MTALPARKLTPTPDNDSSDTYYHRLGGQQGFARIHKALYDKIFAHPVLGSFFAGKDQTYQEEQQTDFMAMNLGGPSEYRGRLPDGAHQHMFITDELFELRHRILAETLDECGVAPELRDQWLRVDYQFKSQIVKQSIDECVKRWGTDVILVAPETT